MRGRSVAFALLFVGCGAHGGSSRTTTPAPAPTQPQEMELGPAPEPPVTPPAVQPTPTPVAGAADPISEDAVVPLDGSRPKESTPQQPVNIDPFGPPPGTKPVPPHGKLGNDPPPEKTDCRKKPALCTDIINKKL